MTSSILDVLLLAALAGTSGAVLLMYRRLKRFDALQSTAAVAFTDAAAALDRAREAMRTLHDEGGDMAVALAARLNEARMVMNDIDDRSIRALRIELVPPSDAEARRDQLPAPASSFAGDLKVTTAASRGDDDRVVPPRHDDGAAAIGCETAADAGVGIAEKPSSPSGPAVPTVAPGRPRATAAVERAGSAMRAAAARALPARSPAAPAATSGGGAAGPLAAAVPQPAPGPLPPRVGLPMPARAPLPPRVEEPKPTLHRAGVPRISTAAARPIPARGGYDAQEPTFGTRAITWTDLARAARRGDLAHAG